MNRYLLSDLGEFRVSYFDYNVLDKINERISFILSIAINFLDIASCHAEVFRNDLHYMLGSKDLVELAEKQFKNEYCDLQYFERIIIPEYQRLCVEIDFEGFIRGKSQYPFWSENRIPMSTSKTIDNSRGLSMADIIRGLVLYQQYSAWAGGYFQPDQYVLSYQDNQIRVKYDGGLVFGSAR